LGWNDAAVVSSRLLLLFANQLFHPRHLQELRGATVVLVEDPALCRRHRYHKQKLTFVLAALRAHVVTLRRAGFKVVHRDLDCGTGWQAATEAALAETNATMLCHFDLESPALAGAVRQLADRSGVRLQVLQTPMFLDSPSEFAAHVAARKTPRLTPYYQHMRRRLDVLVAADGKPLGGRFSFDHDNRRRLPAALAPPRPRVGRGGRLLARTRAEVERRFGDHPGAQDEFWLPVTHASAERWLEDFLHTRFRHFGTYEDALTVRSDFVYHSALSPLLNVGLLTPREVLDKVLSFARAERVPINSVEGFVRQLIGWREFVRGVYRTHGRQLAQGNAWHADRKLTPAWYTASTGLLPLDHVIAKVGRLGYAHHIERLMVVANLMNLAGVHPREAYRWFMEMFVDAYPWVMAPNVFGMGLASDGGIFTTKPYICGSNYLRKMSDYAAGPWCDVVDGLYWRFVLRNQARLSSNSRLRVTIAAARRVVAKRPHIIALADAFIDEATERAA
jgi:deoxyribodipyrimidine photolyase-related protein